MQIWTDSSREMMFNIDEPRHVRPPLQVTVLYVNVLAQAK